jgi:hypothetical protein
VWTALRWQGKSLIMLLRSVRPYFRPTFAARTPLAFILSADQIPIQKTRSATLWDGWVRLVPGSTGLA